MTAKRERKRRMSSFCKRAFYESQKYIYECVCVFARRRQGNECALCVSAFRDEQISSLWIKWTVVLRALEELLDFRFTAPEKLFCDVALPQLFSPESFQKNSSTHVSGINIKYIKCLSPDAIVKLISFCDPKLIHFADGGVFLGIKNEFYIP